MPVSGPEATTEPPSPRKDEVRDAATIVLTRRDGDEPRLLMGQRGKKAAFMPSKFVFPGGAVDASDADVARVAALPEQLSAALSARSAPGLAEGLAMAAIRELWEETGLALAEPWEGPEPADLSEDWRSFFAAGHRPDPARLAYIFRAITPPGRPRRFDARFFLVEAEAIRGDLDDFSGACDELSHLSWLSIAEARRLDLPFITEVVLAEIEARLAEPDRTHKTPFFHHAEGRSFIEAL